MSENGDMPTRPSLKAAVAFLLALLGILLLAGGCRDPVAPEPELRVGWMSGDSLPIFWATVEPADTILWALVWPWGGIEGRETERGAVAVQAPDIEPLGPYVWRVRSGELRDSLYWDGGGMFAGLFWWMTEYMRAEGIPPWW